MFVCLFIACIHSLYHSSECVHSIDKQNACILLINTWTFIKSNKTYSTLAKNLHNWWNAHIKYYTSVVEHSKQERHTIWWRNTNTNIHKKNYDIKSRSYSLRNDCEYVNVCIATVHRARSISHCGCHHPPSHKVSKGIDDWESVT